MEKNKETNERAGISRQIHKQAEVKEEIPFLEVETAPEIVGIPTSTIDPLNVIEETGIKATETSQEATSIEGATNKELQPSETDKISGRFDSPEALAKSYGELEKKFTQSSQTHADRERFLEDMVHQLMKSNEPAPTTASPTPILPDNMQEMFLDRPEEAMKIMTEQITNSVMEKVDSSFSKQEAKMSNAEAKNHLVTKYPEYMTDELIPILNGYAGKSNKDTLVEKYEDAIEQYKVFVDRVKETTVPVVTEKITQANDLKEKARLESHSTTKPVVKFTHEGLGKMMRDNPDEYARRQPEIMDAYAKGLVR